MKEPMVKSSFRWEVELKKAIEARAKRERTTPSQLLREVLTPIFLPKK